MKYFSVFFLAGVSTHSLDFLKSAGGFIHGYRYSGKYIGQSGMSILKSVFYATFCFAH